MSKPLFGCGGLRFWNKDEIERREMYQSRIISVVQNTLLEINPAWKIMRVEGPILCPRNAINKEYNERDIFVTNHESASEKICLRPETTATSYIFAKNSGNKLPLCVYQVGKSFRRELNDGASASKLRFNEFWQLEFQCIYSNSTKCDYRSILMDKLVFEFSRFTGKEVNIVDSDRIPSYSLSTKDIQIKLDDRFFEVASCSIRKDYSDDISVCEIAIGLDRLVELAN